MGRVPKLNKCPFCSSTKVGIARGYQIAMVICSDCGATVSFAGHITPEECARSWNRRKKRWTEPAA